MTATTDILQPTPTRGSVKKYSETQPEVAKCHSEHSEDPTGYPRTASEPSETPADPSAKASEPSEMPADPSAAASEHSAALAEPSAGSSGRSVTNSSPKLGEVPVGGRSVSNRRGEGVCGDINLTHSVNGFTHSSGLKATLRASVAQSTVLPSLRHGSTFSASSTAEFASNLGEEAFQNSPSDTLPRPLATLRASVAQSTVLPSLRHGSTFSASSTAEFAPNLGGELNTPHAEVANSSPKLGEVPVGGRSVSNRRAEECVKTVSSNLEGQCKARTHNLSATKSLRRELRTHGTAAEATLWKMLKARQVMGKQFRRQFAVGAYVLDFYCPEARLAVELDGQPHYTIEGDLHDTDRDEYLLATHGIRTLRFENSDVFRNPEGVLEAIKEALTHSSANGFTHSANGFTHSSGLKATLRASVAQSTVLPSLRHGSTFSASSTAEFASNLEEESVTPHAEVFSNSSPKLGEVPVGGRSVSNRQGGGVCENRSL